MILNSKHLLKLDKSQDANYAAWAAYYAQYYAQSQQQAATPTTTAPAGFGSNANGSGADGSAAGQPGDPSQGGANQEALYKQWAEYYRAYGMIKEAEQIEQMMKGGPTQVCLLTHPFVCIVW